MVCLGNICRSPLAEGIMQNKINKQKLNWTVESAATGNWHTGELPHHRSIKVAADNGLDITNQRARQITKSDIDKFDLILVMDDNNAEDVLNLCKNDAQRNKVHLIKQFAGEQGNDVNVPDPYFDDKFEYVYDLLDVTCDSVLKSLLKNKN